ncbi:hypothetical protein BKN38_04745 [Helicobacter sp. CLO-3]|nr:hypothetical protein BA723_06405 [Helicobacter sp. CLO-3]OHU83898.1 hypothetical protein BKN38_04745 [Helicobacter sp. CLO-3]
MAKQNPKAHQNLICARIQSALESKFAPKSKLAPESKLVPESKPHETKPNSHQNPHLPKSISTKIYICQNPTRAKIYIHQNPRLSAPAQKSKLSLSFCRHFAR